MNSIFFPGSVALLSCLLLGACVNSEPEPDTEDSAEAASAEDCISADAPVYTPPPPSVVDGAGDPDAGLGFDAGENPLFECPTVWDEDPVNQTGYSCIIQRFGAVVCHHLYGEWTAEEAQQHCDDRDDTAGACVSPEDGFCVRGMEPHACVQHRAGGKQVWIFGQFPVSICEMFVGDTHVSRPENGWPEDPASIDPRAINACN